MGSSDELAADLRALWATTPPSACRPANRSTTPPPLALPPLPPLADPSPGSKTIEPTGPTSKPIPSATPDAPEAFPSIDSPGPSTSTGSPAVRCRDHADRRNWLEAPAANRPGWLRTVCGTCGGFVGYRPAAADKTSKP